MLDLKYIRNNLDEAKLALEKRGFNYDLDSLLSLDSEVRSLRVQLEKLNADRNRLSKEIDKAKRAGKDVSDLMNEVKNVNQGIGETESKLESSSSALQEELDGLPNLVDKLVPPGGKENNQVVKVYGEKPNLPVNAKDHVQLCTELDLVDYERGVKLGGAGFWVYKNLGAALEWALLNYFCSRHYKDGYQFLLPPHILVYECGYAAGQFPKFKEDVFHIAGSGKERERFLLPTSETAILNIYRNEILEESMLPYKAFAYSPCYRSEAGGYRAEERGTVRGHQFNKVEMFQFVKPEQSEQALKELVSRAEMLMEDLGLHFRTTFLAAGDTSPGMAMTYDVEVWIPSMKIYKEVSSISWARDYQARRAKIRFKRKGQSSTEYVHTLNASGLATSRLLPAIIEQNQKDDGSIEVPVPLREWLGVDYIR